MSNKSKSAQPLDKQFRVLGEGDMIRLKNDVRQKGRSALKGTIGNVVKVMGDGAKYRVEVTYGTNPTSDHVDMTPLVVSREELELLSRMPEHAKDGYWNPSWVHPSEYQERYDELVNRKRA